MDVSIIIGLGILAFLSFQLWFDLRSNEKQDILGDAISSLFFILGMFLINILTFSIASIIQNDATVSYLGWMGNALIMVVMWTTLIVSVILSIKFLWGSIRNLINKAFEQVGWSTPFK
jgi:hypothetical protein